jgi:hypothetical protein
MQMAVVTQLHRLHYFNSDIPNAKSLVTLEEYVLPLRIVHMGSKSNVKDATYK